MASFSFKFFFSCFAVQGPMLKLDFGLCARVSQRFCPILRPPSHFPPGQRFPLPKHVTSGSGDVTSGGPFPLSPQAPLSEQWFPVTMRNPITNHKSEQGVCMQITVGNLPI